MNNNAFKLTVMCKVMALVATLSACSFLEIDTPGSEIANEAVFNNVATAESALAGIYSELDRQGIASGGQSSISVVNGLYADELRSHLVYLDDYFNNSIAPDDTYLTNNLWGQSYKLVYDANLALEYLASSTALSVSVKHRLMGEAMFIRAFLYFHLVNLWDRVPLVLVSDYRINQAIKQYSADEIYKQIVTDLSASQTMLADDYGLWGDERIRPTKWAAKALLARVHLYREDWQAAAREADSILRQEHLFSLSATPSGVFGKNSTEAIWQLKPTEPGRNTREATFFIPTTPDGPPTTVSVAPDLAAGFNPDDHRQQAWLDSVTVDDEVFYYPFKYKIKDFGEPLEEYQVVFRLAEQLLIRAEANTHLGNAALAAADVNALRARAGLQPLPLSGKADLLRAIRNERRHEFFAEWGHRFFDLKRWGIADSVLSEKKANWQHTAIAFPIPDMELQRNKELSPNPGY